MTPLSKHNADVKTQYWCHSKKSLQSFIWFIRLSVYQNWADCRERLLL